jgi:hypothetical protein
MTSKGLEHMKLTREMEEMAEMAQPPTTPNRQFGILRLRVGRRDNVELEAIPSLISVSASPLPPPPFP